MNWKKSELRHAELKNGDIVVCKLLDNVNWNQTGIALGIYLDGQIYDAYVKEDDNLHHDEWSLTDREVEYGVHENLVDVYCFTGENVDDLISPLCE